MNLKANLTRWIPHIAITAAAVGAAIRHFAESVFTRFFIERIERRVETMSTSTTVTSEGATTTTKSENFFEKLGHDIKVGAEDVGKDVVQVIEFPDKLTKVISTVMTDYPQLKAEVAQLVTLGKSALADGVVAVAAKGLVWTDDVKTVEDVQAFASYFTGTFIPAFESAFKTINGEAAPAPAPTPSPAKQSAIAYALAAQQAVKK